MGIGARRTSLRAEADHRLEKALDAMHATKDERVLGRRLFDEQAARTSRDRYGSIIDRVTRTVEEGRKAGADATADRA